MALGPLASCGAMRRERTLRAARMRTVRFGSVADPTVEIRRTLGIRARGGFLWQNPFVDTRWACCSLGSVVPIGGSSFVPSVANLKPPLSFQLDNDIAVLREEFDLRMCRPDLGHSANCAPTF